MFIWLDSLFINAGGDEVCVGLDEGGNWYLKKSFPHRLDKNSEEAMLLPLMEPGYGGTLIDVKKRIRSRLKDKGFDVTFAETFPYSVPVRTALKHKMGHWIGLAVNWVPEVDLDLDLAEMIVEILDERWIDQKYRHKLKRELHKWERDNGYTLIRK